MNGATNPAELENAMSNGTCGKCGGTGKLRGFAHVEAGRCFGCGGSGRVFSRKAAAPKSGDLAGQFAVWCLDDSTCGSMFPSIDAAQAHATRLAEVHGLSYEVRLVG